MINREIPPLPIPITIKAQRKLQEYSTSLNLKEGTGVRIGVKKKGVHLKKIIGFDTKRFTDETYEKGGLRFYIDRRELKHFESFSIDYQENSKEKGFLFDEVAKEDS